MTKTTCALPNHSPIHRGLTTPKLSVLPWRTQRCELTLRTSHPPCEDNVVEVLVRCHTKLCEQKEPCCWHEETAHWGKKLVYALETEIVRKMAKDATPTGWLKPSSQEVVWPVVFNKKSHLASPLQTWLLLTTSHTTLLKRSRAHPNSQKERHHP